jgi:hypothetical protein
VGERADTVCMETTLATALAGASDSRLYQHIGVLDAATAAGVRHGYVIHVGRDRNLLVMWDDDDSTSIVAPEALVEATGSQDA